MHSVIDSYLTIVKKGYLTIDEIPEQYRQEVIERLEGENENE